MLFFSYCGSTEQVNSRGFKVEKFLVFLRLAGVPFPIACAALPSPSSSIIYGAIARICPEIHTRQSFNFLLPRRPFRVADKLESCQSVCPRCHCCSWPLSASRGAMLTSVPLSVAGQQGSWGCRLLFRTAEADMGEEVSNGIGRLGLIDFTSHILLRPNHHWLRVKYVCSYPLLIKYRYLKWHHILTELTSSKGILLEP